MALFLSLCCASHLPRPVCLQHHTYCVLSPDLDAAAGGDSVSAVNKLQPVPPMSYISTGGGASLELIRGEPLPGITALARAAMRRQA
jgi:3-phosphoglycerate kinase